MASLELKYDRPTKTFRDFADGFGDVEDRLEGAMLEAVGEARGGITARFVRRVESRLNNEGYPSEGGGHDGRSIRDSTSFSQPVKVRKHRARAGMTAGKGVPYAGLLASGTKSSLVDDFWRIPAEGSGPISFIPQDISKYPESSHGTGEYEGYVTLEQVNWKGRTDGRYNATTGYKFHFTEPADTIDSREDIKDMLRFVFDMEFPGRVGPPLTE